MNKNDIFETLDMVVGQATGEYIDCLLYTSYVLGQYMGLGLIGVWIAMFVDWIVRVIFFVWRYLSGKWMNRQLI